MEQFLLNLFNQHGILEYSFIISLITILYTKILDIIYNFGSFLYEKGMYYRDKRKEFKKNGS